MIIETAKKEDFISLDVEKENTKVDDACQPDSNNAVSHRGRNYHLHVYKTNFMTRN